MPKNTDAANEYPIDTKAAAAAMLLAEQTLRSKMSRGDDLPPYRKVGRRVLWYRSEIREWLDRRIVNRPFEPTS